MFSTVMEQQGHFERNKGKYAAAGALGAGALTVSDTPTGGKIRRAIGRGIVQAGKKTGHETEAGELLYKGGRLLGRNRGAFNIAREGGLGTTAGYGLGAGKEVAKEVSGSVKQNVNKLGTALHRKYQSLKGE